MAFLSFSSVAGPGFQPERYSDLKATPSKRLTPPVKHGVDQAGVEAPLQSPLRHHQSAFAEPPLNLLRRAHAAFRR